LITNAALDALYFGYGMGDDSLAPEEQDPETDGISVRVRAKRYVNSVRWCIFLVTFIVFWGFCGCL
jgi:hypothetical protein